MKVFNIENGKKKVYVQLNDIMMLMHFGSTIPVEVMENHFSVVFIVTDENRFEFSEFTEPSTVEFFEQCDWIVDYKQYRGLTEEQIIGCGQEIAGQMNEIATRWNEMSPDEREKHEELTTEHEKLEFKMHSLADILWTKQGHRVMPFPVVPDSDGFVLENADCTCVARQGINPTQVLVYRKDGKTMDRRKDILPSGVHRFIQSAEAILIDSNLNSNEFFGNIKRKRYLSEAGMYAVTEFIIVPTAEK